MTIFDSSIYDLRCKILAHKSNPVLVALDSALDQVQHYVELDNYGAAGQVLMGQFHIIKANESQLVSHELVHDIALLKRQVLICGLLILKIGRKLVFASNTFSTQHYDVFFMSDSFLLLNKAICNHEINPETVKLYLIEHGLQNINIY